MAAIRKGYETRYSDNESIHYVSPEFIADLVVEHDSVNSMKQHHKAEIEALEQFPYDWDLRETCTLYENTKEMNAMIKLFKNSGKMDLNIGIGRYCVFFFCFCSCFDCIFCCCFELDLLNAPAVIIATSFSSSSSLNYLLFPAIHLS